MNKHCVCKMFSVHLERELPFEPAHDRDQSAESLLSHELLSTEDDRAPGE